MEKKVVFKGKKILRVFMPSSQSWSVPIEKQEAALRTFNIHKGAGIKVEQEVIIDNTSFIAAQYYFNKETIQLLKSTVNANYWMVIIESIKPMGDIMFLKNSEAIRLMDKLEIILIIQDTL